METALDFALALAPPNRRAALRALFALDARLGTILRSTGEPIVGQMRLAWWREALMTLDEAPPPAEPVLVELARSVLPLGVRGATLAAMTDGWEALLSLPAVVPAPVIASFAAARGGGLFAAAATMLGGIVPPSAGEGWAAADLSHNLSDRAGSLAARRVARDRLEEAFTQRFARSIRPLGVLALLAAFDLREPRPLADAINMVRFRCIGRHRLEIGGAGDSL